MGISWRYHLGKKNGDEVDSLKSWHDNVYMHRYGDDLEDHIYWCRDIQHEFGKSRMYWYRLRDLQIAFDNSMKLFRLNQFTLGCIKTSQAINCKFGDENVENEIENLESNEDDYIHKIKGYAYMVGVMKDFMDSEKLEEEEALFGVEYC